MLEISNLQPEIWPWVLRYLTVPNLFSLLCLRPPEKCINKGLVLTLSNREIHFAFSLLQLKHVLQNLANSFCFFFTPIEPCTAEFGKVLLYNRVHTSVTIPYVNPNSKRTDFFSKSLS